MNKKKIMYLIKTAGEAVAIMAIGFVMIYFGCLFS